MPCVLPRREEVAVAVEAIVASNVGWGNVGVTLAVARYASQALWIASLTPARGVSLHFM